MSAIIYLHGFLSSPASTKAQVVKAYLHEHEPAISFHCPHLTPYPRQCQRELEALVEFLQPEPLWLMGSSLGGFWATWLAERHNLPAVLINPAVRPWTFMPEYLGVDLKGYHTDDSYRLDAGHIDEIRAVDCPLITRPDNYWLLVQTGDETLDYREAVEKYRLCRQTVETGGSHAFEDFERHLPAMVRFFREFSPTEERKY